MNTTEMITTPIPTHSITVWPGYAQLGKQTNYIYFVQ